MKPPKDNALGVAQEWLVHAVSDLRYAKRGLNDPVILGAQVCFHAQQAAEKAIKALLLAHGKDFPFTHDIETLVHLLKRHSIPISSSVTCAGRLTPYAVQLRYPGDVEEDVDKDEVRDAIVLAEHVVGYAKITIGKIKKRNK